MPIDVEVDVINLEWRKIMSTKRFFCIWRANIVATSDNLKDWKKQLQKLLGVTMVTDTPHGMMANGNLPLSSWFLQRLIQILDDIFREGGIN